jgi:hypothetical protein
VARQIELSGASLRTLRVEASVGEFEPLELWVQSRSESRLGTELIERYHYLGRPRRDSKRHLISTLQAATSNNICVRSPLEYHTLIQLRL